MDGWIHTFNVIQIEIPLVDVHCSKVSPFVDGGSHCGLLDLLVCFTLSDSFCVSDFLIQHVWQ